MNILLAVIIGIIIFVIFFCTFKIPKIGTLVMTTGGVKTGKSLLTVWFVIRSYGKAMTRYYINCVKCFFKKQPLPEKPLIYSNIPLGVPYVQLTEDLLLRKTRFRYGSVIYVCEASLVADSMYFRNLDDNERLLLFNKLIGHETRGGQLFYDSQCVDDVHFSIKRSLSQYFYIHRIEKRIPFVCLLYVKEYMYQSGNNVLNVETQDIENSMKCVVVPKKMFKYYDCYCYSALTDHLPVEDTIKKPLKRNRKYNLKANYIVSFKRYFRNREYLNNESKNDNKST